MLALILAQGREFAVSAYVTTYQSVNCPHVVSRKMRKTGKPAAFMIHSEIAFQRVLMAFGIKQKLKRMHAAIRIPDAVVHHIGASVFRMHFSVVADILAVCACFMHAAKRAVKRGIENGLSVFVIAFYTNLGKKAVPCAFAF